LNLFLNSYSETPTLLCAKETWSMHKSRRGSKKFSFSNDGSVIKVYGTEFFVENQYRLRKALGRGAYGIVCSARHVKTGEKVAIKRIHPMAEQTYDAKHTLREIRLLRYLGRHRNIISLKNLFVREKKDELYITMELMDTDLHKLVQSPQSLTVAHYRHFMYQLVEGLRFMHEHDILHRDLKPANLLLSKNCDLKITDFGLARMSPEVGLVDDPRMTEHVVTRWYRPPELMLSADGKYTKAVDLWSVGCIFAEMLGRTPLFPGKNFMHQLTLIFDVIGTPTQDQIRRLGITNSQALKFLRDLPRKTKIPFSSLFPIAGADACDLLDKLLELEPKKRIDVNAALAHKFFDPIREQMRKLYQDNTVDADIGFDFEHTGAERDELKQLIIEETENFREQTLANSNQSRRTRPASARRRRPASASRGGRSKSNKLEKTEERIKSRKQIDVKVPARSITAEAAASATREEEQKKDTQFQKEKKNPLKAVVETTTTVSNAKKMTPSTKPRRTIASTIQEEKERIRVEEQRQTSLLRRKRTSTPKQLEKPSSTVDLIGGSAKKTLAPIVPKTSSLENSLLNKLKQRRETQSQSQTQPEEEKTDVPFEKPETVIKAEVTKKSPPTAVTTATGVVKDPLTNTQRVSKPISSQSSTTLNKIRSKYEVRKVLQSKVEKEDMIEHKENIPNNTMHEKTYRRERPSTAMRSRHSRYLQNSYLRPSNAMRPSSALRRRVAPQDTTDTSEDTSYVPLTRAERLQRLVAGKPVRNRSRHQHNSQKEEKRAAAMESRLQRLVAGLPVRQNTTKSQRQKTMGQSGNIPGSTVTSMTATTTSTARQRRIKAYSPKFTKLARRRRLDRIYR